MKKTPGFFAISSLVPLILLLVVSCADTERNPSILLEGMDQQKILQSTSNRSMENIAKESTEISFSVIYEGDLDEILFSSTSHLRALVETYELQLSEPFEIDERMKGIVMRSYTTLKNPLEIAKEISRCEEVLMVEAKNLPETVALSL